MSAVKSQSNTEPFEPSKPTNEFIPPFWPIFHSKQNAVINVLCVPSCLCLGLSVCCSFDAFDDAIEEAIEEDVMEFSSGKQQHQNMSGKRQFNFFLLSLLVGQSYF